MNQDFKNWMEDHVFTPSELETYLLCPFRFYIQFFLRLEPEVRWEVEMTPAETGRILHKILERFLQGMESEKDRKILEDQMIRLMEEEIEIFKSDRPNLSLVLLERHKKRISRTLLSFLENLLFEGTHPRSLKPRYLEWSFGKNTPPLEIQNLGGKPIRICGRVDRIDIDPIQKRFLVIDYKTGSNKVNGHQIRSGESLQLPIYILAIRDLLLPDHEPIGGLYYQLSDMTMTNGILHADRLPDFLELNPRSSSLVPSLQWDQIFLMVTEKIQSIAGLIRKGQFDANPENCNPSCPYQDICRIRSL